MHLDILHIFIYADLPDGVRRVACPETRPLGRSLGRRSISKPSYRQSPDGNI